MEKLNYSHYSCTEFEDVISSEKGLSDIITYDYRTQQVKI